MEPASRPRRLGESLVRALLATALAGFPAAVGTALALAPFVSEHVVSEGPQSQGAVGIAAALFVAAPVMLVLFLAAIVIAWRRPRIRPSWQLVLILAAVPPMVTFIVRSLQHLARL